MSDRQQRRDRLTAARLASLSALERADIAATRALEPVLRSRPGRAIGRLGNLADEPTLLGLSALTCALGLILRQPRLARAGARMISAHLLATGFKEIGKDRIDRSRPMALLDRQRYRMSWGRSRKAALRSFPSGHAAGAFALARAASRELPIGRSAHAVAGTLGALQVVRRAHFPGDVVAGALLGIAAEAATATLFAAAARLARRPRRDSKGDVTKLSRR